jgi:hypothetical protein
LNRTSTIVAHPGLRVAAEAERDAARYAQALLLTPESRKRHNIEPPGDDYLERELAKLTGLG